MKLEVIPILQSFLWTEAAPFSPEVLLKVASGNKPQIFRSKKSICVKIKKNRKKKDY